jgi:hypothetical protein
VTPKYNFYDFPYPDKNTHTPQWIIPAIIITLAVLVLVLVSIVAWMLGRRHGGVPAPTAAAANLEQVVMPPQEEADLESGPSTRSSEEGAGFMASIALRFFYLSSVIYNF